MLYFLNDYSEGAHEKVLQHLIDTNMEQLPGYGSDHYCEEAKEKIKKACGREDAEVYLLTGGTQTNQIVIDTVLNPYEGVVAAQTGHVSAHEAGAIEFTGHKVLTLPEKEGKINAEDLRNLVETFYGDESHEHMVFPGMVYISHPTEYGTLYTRKELEELSATCREFKLPLYMDGARLIYGLVSKETDVTLQDIAELCDIFYIGGTKAGALCGEAVVFTGETMPKYFLTRVKQHGALLAKGRLLGVQFDALFTDELYLEIGKNAIETAAVLKEGLKEKKYKQKIQNSIENSYDLTLFYQGIENLQLSKKMFDQEDEKIIQQLGILYHINALDMQDLVKQSMIENHLNSRLLAQNCRNYYDLKMPEKFTEIFHKQSPLLQSEKQGESSLQKHIYYLENISPYDLLKDKTGGKEPLKRDLQVVESVLTTLQLEPGVVNVLIETTLQKCDQSLPKNFIEALGSQWKRKKIKTVQEAIEEGKAYLKYQNQQNHDWDDFTKDIQIVSQEKSTADNIDEDALAMLEKYD